MNTRNSRTSRANAPKADAPAPVPADQPTQVELDPQAPDANAAQPEDAAAQAEATPDAAPVPVRPDETDPATSITESDETVTDTESESESEVHETPVVLLTPDPAASEKPAAQLFAEMLAAATAVTTEQESKLVAFASAITIARTMTLQILAVRKDDEIIHTVTVPVRPDSSSGRGPTLALLFGYMATALGGAGFTSWGNCHDATKTRPIHANVVIPTAAVHFWDSIAQALDAPGGPIRYAEANVKSAARATLKAGGQVNRSIYHMENHASRRNMLETGAQLLALIPAVTTDDAPVMRDLITATTAEFARATSIALIPTGPTYIVPPVTTYDVKQELAPASA
jgi:hypothetical protein